MKTDFIVDLFNDSKSYYIDSITAQIKEIKPSKLHGVYDFGLIGEYENILRRIQSF
jgi:hypothetical protein